MLNKYKNENNYMRIEFYLKRYPEKSLEECKEMLNNKTNRAKQKISMASSGSNNGNSKENTSDMDRKERSPKCIEFYLKRYPEKSLEECKEMLNKHIKYTLSKLTDEKYTTKIEYYLAKGYSLNEAKKLLKERQTTFSLKKCIEKYGEEKGNMIFNNRQQKWKKSLYSSKLKENLYQSKIANEFFEQLISIFGGEKEFPLEMFLFDYKYKNILIEFNGDYWHCNPLFYKKDDINKTNKKTAKEIWKYDDFKRKISERHNYKLLTIWESEYNKDKNAVLNKCIDFINRNVI